MVLLFKATGIWLIMVIAAILNGLLRDALLAPALGSEIALPLSGISLSLLILVIAYLLIPLVGKHSGRVFMAIGIFWVMLTLCFEYGFGHYVVGTPWHEIHQVFNLFEGNLFSLALLSSALSPWLVNRFRR